MPFSISIADDFENIERNGAFAAAPNVPYPITFSKLS